MRGTQHSESQFATGSLSFQTDSRRRTHLGREDHKRFVRLKHSFAQLTDSSPYSKSKACNGILRRLTVHQGNQRQPESLKLLYNAYWAYYLLRLTESNLANEQHTPTHRNQSQALKGPFAQYAMGFHNSTTREQKPSRYWSR